MIFRDRHISIPGAVFTDGMSDSMKRMMEDWRDLINSESMPYIPPWEGAYSALLQSDRVALVGDGYDALRISFGWPTIGDMTGDEFVTMSCDYKFNRGTDDAARSTGSS